MIVPPPSGAELGRIVADPPGPRSRALAKAMREVESRNVTFIGGVYPIFLAAGAGANLADVDGNIYVDLSAAFGVASVGHSNPRVVNALARQAETMLHGMGDVHPNPEKVELARVLCELAPRKEPKRVIFSSTGAEAVESAMKTAAVASGKPGVICFSGAYHGLTYGALAVTDRELFRAPFERQLGGFVRQLPFPKSAGDIEDVQKALRDAEGPGIGAVIVEPIQGRGGEIPLPAGYLAALRDACNRRGIVLILDEIYTGFGRTGRWFACEHEGVVPDLLCVGKGMAGGFPISACIGKADVMDRWPECGGEAIHTSTFLGHPAGCAAALACIAELREKRLVERAAKLEAVVRTRLQEVRDVSDGRIAEVRGRGLIWGVQCADHNGKTSTEVAKDLAAGLLRRGVIVLESGPRCDVIAITPPLVITEEQLGFAFRALRELIAEVAV